MRLYKAQVLSDYIKQLEHDLKILKAYHTEFIEGDLTGEFEPFELSQRDTYENHSYIVDRHKDNLRGIQNSRKV